MYISECSEMRESDKSLKPELGSILSHISCTNLFFKFKDKWSHVLRAHKETMGGSGNP